MATTGRDPEPTHGHDVGHLTVRVATPGRLVLAGELELGNRHVLRAAIEDALADGVVDLALDVRALTFIDSTALGLLAQTAAQLRDAGGGLALVGASGHVRRVIEVTNLDSLLELRPA